MAITADREGTGGWGNPSPAERFVTTPVPPGHCLGICGSRSLHCSGPRCASADLDFRQVGPVLKLVPNVTWCALVPPASDTYISAAGGHRGNPWCS